MLQIMSGILFCIDKYASIFFENAKRSYVILFDFRKNEYILILNRQDINILQDGNICVFRRCIFNS